ncbi:MAG: glutamate synthase large subunit [Flavobacteriaceae bacterium]|nr:glutamate synthase large subunit [Flavobacteriaceae bacterium]
MQKQGLYLPEFEHENCGAGFICNLKGERTNQIIHDALEILVKLEHRGGVSSDGKTGDGAGLLIDIPHEYFSRVCEFNIPEAREYAVGMVFLPKKKNQYKYCKDTFENEIKAQGLAVLGWRTVPVDSSQLGEIALASEPNIEQIFIGKTEEIDEHIFKAKLYAARKITEHAIAASKMSESSFFYLPSLSNTTLIYKGIIMPEDIGPYFKDLQEPDLVTRLALVHQRFSTNTMPTWELAQPFRFMCQNGEINTLRGNVSRMRVREEIMSSDVFGPQIDKLFPIILPGKSDSASMDMVVELLTHTGRSLPEVMMMMIPEAWEKHETMSEDKKAFYEYNACLMEAWDGPASVPFTDGDYIGALLDRNGLRPSRYTVTKSGKLIMASEIGVVDIADDDIEIHGRLEPGKMFLVDMNEGRIINDEEIKSKIASERPYKKWLKEFKLDLIDIPSNSNYSPIEICDYKTRQRLFNYTLEDIQEVITPMAQAGKEALGSMGIDTPLAVLSDRPQLISNYFKQLFAQVTNPPLDGIREEIVTDISLSLGKDRNIFSITERQCRKLRIQNPVISNNDLDKIRGISFGSFKAETIQILYPKIKGMNGLEEALDDIIVQITKALDRDTNIIILSDRGVNKDLAPIPSLLACSFVNHQMNRLRKRSYFDIIIESAEPREPHQFATLFGYGASAVNPYMVNEIIKTQVRDGFITGMNEHRAVHNFNKAIGKGILKVMNKIGISTLHSYRGSQLFEIVGFNSRFVEKYFPYTASRIEGIGLYEIEREINERYKYAYPDTLIKSRLGLNIGGEYRWRRNGERHLFNPTTVSKLQQAVRLKDQDSYNIYAKAINEQSESLMTIRGLFEFDNLDPIPLDEVEPWTEIVKRFKTGAMSYGSISREAHENLAIAMNRIGGKSNSGEGGEDRRRFIPEANGDSRNSAIKQVASGRFGVTSHYLTNAEEIQIKMAQGAKPGEGGQLPGEKVYPWIADVRNSTPFVGLISPPPHHDIYSIEDLAQLIYDLKNANREARINVKLVSEVGVGTIAAGVSKAKADVVLISGYDGGTGASPLTSLKHAGLPWELGLAEAQQSLVLNNLRSRIVVECDGQLKTGRDVAIAALLGAEEFGFATAPLVASGCIMMRKCHLNTCPVGIATQDKELRKNFKGTPEHVINYFYYIANELREIMALLGFRTLEEMVGQTHKINSNKAITHYKAKGLDLSSILHRPTGYSDMDVKNSEKQDHNLDNVLDFQILKDAKKAIQDTKKVNLAYPIHNTDRTVGAIVSNEISKIHGHLGLPENTLNINFSGSAGQSFGAFGAYGLTFNLEGNTNDYLGKALSGAKLIIKKPTKATFIAEDNVIVGNVCLFGAVAGEAYINGIAGERFAVRNSGATAVVEGVGDHCCEYMTGGKVIVLGSTGRNFAAGMSGGIAYVYDPEDKFTKGLCNTESIEFEEILAEDAADLKGLIEKHVALTDSNRGKELLANWETSLNNFVRVMPTEYKRALKRLETEEPMFEELTA